MSLLLAIIVALLIAAAADMRITRQTDPSTSTRPVSPRRRSQLSRSRRLAGRPGALTSAKWWWE